MSPPLLKSAGSPQKSVTSVSSGVTQTKVKPPTAMPPRPPTGKPLPFTLADIRAAIPAHCFERSALISGSYLLRDIAMLAALGLGIYHADNFLSTSQLPGVLRATAWLVYWIITGQVAMGVWILGHEAGHRAFSTSDLINDGVGWLLHSMLLLPYHSWRISHSHHHAATNSMEDDAVFVPRTRSEALQSPPLLPPTAWAAWNTAIYVLFGWPTYLLFNFPGPAKYAATGTGLLQRSHYNPSAVLFTPAQWWSVVISDIGVLLVWGGVVAASLRWGLLTVIAYYGIPIAIVYGNLVVLTLLQHTDVFVPHFRGEGFSWLAGALCTVDRTYGWGIDTLWHRISDTHVVHHLFSTMPFYHAAEATAAVKDILGEYYLQDPTPIPLALWRAIRHCHFVEDSGETVFYEPEAPEASGPVSASTQAAKKVA